MELLLRPYLFFLGGRCISANHIIKINLMFKLIWKIKLLDGEMDRKAGHAAVHGVVKTQARLGDWTTKTNLGKYLNVKRENLHGEKYSPVLEWAKKIFGPSPETPPSGGMIKKAGAP